MKLDGRWMCGFGLAVVLAGVLAGPVVAQEEAEEEKAISFGADLDLVSRYSWRGFDLNEDFSIQPGIWASAYGFTVSLWAQVATDPIGEGDEEADAVEEVDLTISYAHSFGKIGLEAGLLRYMYPGIEELESTNEVFVAASYETFIAPSVGVYRDLDLDTWYVELGIAPEFSLNEKLTATPGLIFALYSSDDVDDENANRLDPNLSLSYDLGGGLSLSTQAHYVIGVGDDEENVVENQFWAGAGVHVEF